MKIPKITPRTALELKIPDLSGGLNLRDGLSEILDNQLTDCKNVWWNDGVLKTRPGISEIKKITMAGYLDGIQAKQTDCYIGGYRLFYYSTWGSRRTEEDRTEGFSETGFWFQNDYDIIEIDTLQKGNISFVCQKDNTIYVFCESQEIFKMEFNKNYSTPTPSGGWTILTQEEIYVPLVALYCRGNGSLVMREDEIFASGIGVDGYNILSDYYRIQYNSYNPDIDINGSGSLMRYGLLKDVYKPEYVGKVVTVKYTANSGITYTHKVTLTSGVESIEEDKNQRDGFYIRVSSNTVQFIKQNGGPAYATEEESRENNIEITAPYLADYEEKAKVFNMTRCEWFGGDAQGISGGTRLFLCGNKDNNKALVLWSGLNNPLYFPENCYAYVGNESQAVTCFGKQGESLVIFKENGAGTFYTSYNQNSDISAQDLINQSVVDYAASSVYFPIIQLHSVIGCDCPDTVQLCRNRLVWACKDGKVYTLSSKNQFSERNIFCVSAMVERRLCEENLQNAFSADYNGHYLLFTNNHVYVMDYESYGYVYIESHTKEDNAQVKIPWWYWELPSGKYNSDIAIAVITSGTWLYIIFAPNLAAGPSVLLSDISISKFGGSIKDNYAEIPSMAKTKLFDFSQPHLRKIVDKINLQLANNGGEVIGVEIITECGNEKQELLLNGTQTESYTPEYIESKAIFPCISQTVKIGLELTSTGVLAIDGIHFKYRTTGGAR